MSLSFRFPLVALALVGCSEAMPPSRGSAAPNPLEPSPSASVATSVVPAPSSPAVPAASAFSATSAPPAADPAPEAPPEPEDDAPKIDCAKLAKGASPGRRSLCEAAMAMAPAVMLDERGFALITQFESPGDDSDPQEGHQRRRICGDEAPRRIKELYRTIRFKLAQGDDADPWLFCRGLTCQLRGEGEWSTWGTLYFRQSKGKPVLEAWTEIERTLVDPAEVRKREQFLTQGLAVLRGTSCPARKP